MAELRRRLAVLQIPDGGPQQSDPTLAGAAGADLAASGGDDRPRLVFFQHDEVIVHSPQELARDVVAAVGEAAEEASRLVFGPTPVRFPVTTAEVVSYADAKYAGIGTGHAV